MTVLRFEVPGTPAPQGSKRHVGGGRMVESSRDLPAWRSSVAWAARAAHGSRAAMDGPLAVELSFTFPMPASRPKRDRVRGQRWRTVKPDLDKLCRAVFDALTDAGVITDDARIVQVAAMKQERTSDAGVTVHVTQLEEKLFTSKGNKYDYGNIP